LGAISTRRVIAKKKVETKVQKKFGNGPGSVEQSDLVAVGGKEKKKGCFAQKGQGPEEGKRGKRVVGPERGQRLVPGVVTKKCKRGGGKRFQRGHLAGPRTKRPPTNCKRGKQEKSVPLHNNKKAAAVGGKN